MRINDPNRQTHDASGPIAPLTSEHLRLLELLSTGLTIYEVAVLLEVKPEPCICVETTGTLIMAATHATRVVQSTRPSQVRYSAVADKRLEKIALVCGVWKICQLIELCVRRKWIQGEESNV